MRTLTHFAVLALVASATGAFAQGEEPYLGKVFFGIEGDEVALPEDKRYESTWGIQLNHISALSSAHKAGLRVGDIVVSIDGTVWKNEQIRLSRSFGKAGDKARPGEIARCMVLRRDPAKPDDPGTLETIDVVLTRYPRTEPEDPRAPTNAELRPDLADSHPVYEAPCNALIAKAGYADDTADLLARLDRCDQFPDPDRQPILRYVLRDPFKLEAVTREICSPLAGDAPPTVETLLSTAAAAFVDFDRRTARPPEPLGIEASYAGKDLDGHLEYVESVLRTAAEWHRRAFANITPEEADQILKHRMPLLDAFLDVKMLSYDSDLERQLGYLPILDSAGKVDLRALLQQARCAAMLVNSAFTESLLQAAEASGKNLDAATVASRPTDIGEILIAGRARNRHMGKDYAALYDLGGDDVYANNQASSIWGSIPSAIIVDYAGDDAYESHAPFTQGCGDMGVGILADLSGNDSYIGMKYTQAAGFCGVGMILDESGDDVYRGLQIHQGIGHWGVGILADRGGNDRYEAHVCSQAVGLPGGFGLLHDAGSGTDSYYCKGDEPSGYGTAGVFEGWGQGAGFGYRPYASGGVGVLLDQGGADRMEAGNFSQGGGYFYGLGVLYCGGPEDDRYIGSRWAQGFGCHQAVGAMIESGGDDIYQTRYAVAQGIAWDEAVSLFVDESGNDRYEGGGFSQGASANNGFAIFLELAGDDTYLYTDQARAGGNTYHGGKSLSFFVDAGGGADAYPSRKDGDLTFDGENAIFLDATSAADSLTADLPDAAGG